MGNRKTVKGKIAIALISIVIGESGTEKWEIGKR